MTTKLSEEIKEKLRQAESDNRKSTGTEFKSARQVLESMGLIQITLNPNSSGRGEREEIQN